EYERDCEIRIQKLKQDFNIWGSEVRKKEKAYEDEKYAAACRYMLSVTCDDDDDDDLGFYAVHPNTIHIPVSQTIEPKDSLIMGDFHMGASPSLEVTPLTFQPHSLRERPGLGIMKHTKPETQEFSNKSASGTVTVSETKQTTPSVPIEIKDIEQESKINELTKLVQMLINEKILKAKAKPFLPCTHYGSNDHRPDDCRNYPECGICRSYDHSTSGHNRVIHIRGGVLAESPQYNESSIGVKCNTCGSTVHSTTKHNKFDHFKRGEKIQAAKAREPTKNGCSRSMTGVKSYMHKYVEQLGPKVVFGDNSSCITEKDDVYVLDISSLTPNGACFFAKALESVNWLWHKRLSHLNFKKINKLAKQNKVLGLPSLVYSKDKPCIACEKGKHHRASFKTKQNFSIRKCLHLLHMDLFKPVSPMSINHEKCTLVIVDEYSRYTWVYFLKKKSQAPEVIMSFIRIVENQNDAKVKQIRTDNGTEFRNHELESFCDEKGISQNFSSPYTPEQNGIAERKNRTLIEVAITMLNDSLLFKHFWTEAIRIACKFNAKADDRYFLGYSFVSKAFRVFNARRQQVEKTYHVTFDESMEAIRFTNTSVDEIGINDSSMYPPENHVPEVIAPNEPEIPHTEDTEGPPDLINTEGTHEQNVQNDQMITQPTDVPSGNNTEVLGSTTEPLVPDVTQSHISNQAFTSSHPAPHDRWLRYQHIELVNIIGDPGEGILTRSMAAKLTVASASECLFADFLSEIEPKKVSEALKHPRWIDVMQEELNQFYKNKSNPKESHLTAVKRILRYLKEKAFRVKLCQYLVEILVCWRCQEISQCYVHNYSWNMFAAAGCYASILDESQLSDYDIHYKMTDNVVEKRLPTVPQWSIRTSSRSFGAMLLPMTLFPLTDETEQRPLREFLINQKDSVSPLPLAAKPKKGKSQTVTPTLPKSQGHEISGALSKKSKRPKSKNPPTKTKGTRTSKPLPDGTATHPKETRVNIQPLNTDLTSTTSDEGTTKTTPRSKGSLRDKDSGGNIPPSDMEPIHPTVAKLSGTGAKYQVDQTQSTRFRYQSLPKNKGKPSHEGELDTQPIVLSIYANHDVAAVNYADLKASIDDYYDENIAHRDQTDKLVEASMSSLNKSSNTISDLYKGLNIIIELLKEIKHAVKDDSAHALKQDEQLTAWAKYSTNMAWNLGSRLERAQNHIQSSMSSLKEDTYSIKNMTTEIYKVFKGQSSGSVTPTLALTHIPANIKGENATNTAIKEPPSHTEGETGEPKMDSSKKLVPASTIVRSDPDEEVKVHYMINRKMCYLANKEMQAYLDREEKLKKAVEEERLLAISKPEVIKVVLEEAEKIILYPKKITSAKAGEKFKKAQDAEHQVLKREHTEKTFCLWCIWYERIRKIPEELGIKSALLDPVPAPEQASSKSSRKKRKHMELEPKIKVIRLECNRALLKNVPFINNMVIEEPKYGFFFTDEFGDQAFQRWSDIVKVGMEALVSYLIAASMVKSPENARFSLKLKKLIVEHPDQEKLKSKKVKLEALGYEMN
ncbi:retrovirus-related pol polyprotein from transposon TNT 1-94, partial [Tanacetum coccineum]